ncbi:FixH family protein [Bacillus sp. 31A1R]|uniref:FixH family protein n=1 Tax=Robertmurraya mangrovi TaxID=3098077 RepID=A0ABU5J494_9BACI|nr:FixH family protein [Bacillus sp. 31A1R]MDZ5474172.1 FixH family protein [Bacillus sp. 31A1R]
MKKWIIILLIMALSGCGVKEDELPELIEVKFRTNPEEIKINEEVQLVATVVQGKEQVDDASKVQFELWKEGTSEDQHLKLSTKHQKDGIYIVKYTFEEPGKYYIISHTTARGLHVMPKNEFIVK